MPDGRVRALGYSWLGVLMTCARYAVFVLAIPALFEFELWVVVLQRAISEVI